MVRALAGIFSTTFMRGGGWDAINHPVSINEPGTGNAMKRRGLVEYW
jgi:hypothetical protein